MNHPFLIQLRRLSADLNDINDIKIEELRKLEYEYTTEAERIIIQNRDTGKAYLTSNLQELLNDQSLIEARVKARLNILRNEGLDDYDQLYANAKEVALTLEGALSGLLQLLTIYFPEAGKNYQSLLNEYLRFDVTKLNQNIKRDWEEHFDDERTNEEIFLSKVIANPVSNFKFTSLDNLIDSMIRQANFDFNKYKNEIEQEIDTLPTRREFTINREFEKRQQDFKTMVDGNLIIDKVLIKPDEFPEAFKLLAHIINHFDSDHITYIIHLTIKRLALLKKINFLNCLIQPVSTAVSKSNQIVEKKFHKDIDPEDIKRGFEELGFLELEKVKDLLPDQLDKLYILLAENNGEKAPHYLVAMLNYLDFLTFLSKKISKNELLNERLSKITGRDKRSIKGNIAVLDTNSTENRLKYKSNKYQQKVIDNYNSL